MATAFGTQVTTTLVPMECGECGIIFGISEAKYSRCKQRGENWYCPNGHERIFSKSKNAELAERIEQLERRNGVLNEVIQNKNHHIEQLDYSVRAQKAAKTKIMNRVKNGVCPCCNRTFQNLQSHFKNTHPELISKP